MGPKIKICKQKKYRSDVIATAQASGFILQFWNALLVGDDLTIISIIDDPECTYLIDAIYDTSNIEEWKNFRFNYRGLRLWSLTYEQELTTPLHVTAGRGFTECLRHLLQRGARVDLAPGGTTALHEACEECQQECAMLLLQYGANANEVNEDGQMPLHVCTELESLECAKHLISSGAVINGQSLYENDTPLHVAARHGLPGHVELYLRYGAALNLQNDEGLTPLNSACSQPQDRASLERYTSVCHLLVSAGADIHISDADKQTPLHMACKNVNPDVVELLLKHKASVNEMDYSADAPMHNILKGVAYKVDNEPERIVQALLNYGSIRVWPGALPKVLKYCCISPRTIEVLFNAYDRLKITDAWVEAVPTGGISETPGILRILVCTDTNASISAAPGSSQTPNISGRSLAQGSP
ncbi:ankyrin repeat and SOCS box protein 10-like isoform X2 [Myxocyprinus asiaticus]|uniref:ankyrin repeat and SOCS box protein 10-like isoform X2 n=1 Tax=Myxocyprinus asiaticus TaxID=70543 RepID=UPI002223A4C2|nr:ankyrin repeat and SOCS box protein 10-like isoform X2 [Myxocyprinus asiaticus]